MRALVKGALIAGLSLGLAGPGLGLVDSTTAEAAPPARATKSTANKKSKARAKSQVKRGKPAKRSNVKGRSASKRMPVRGDRRDGRGGRKTGGQNRAGDTPLVRYFVLTQPKAGKGRIVLTAQEDGPLGVFVRRVGQQGFHTQKTFNAKKGDTLSITLPENTNNPNSCVAHSYQYELSIMKGIERPGSVVTPSNEKGSQVKVCLNRAGAFFNPNKAYGGKTPTGNINDLISAHANCMRPGADPWPDPDPERCR
ncbi:MAG: hypothetical protein ACE366_14840 [Bradymonadia bacterium]